MTFTIEQNMVFIAIFISILVDVFVKPAIKPFAREVRAGISRIIIFVLSLCVMYYLQKENLFMDSIVVSVLAMLFYDVAGYSLLKKKVKERLGGSDITLER